MFLAPDADVQSRVDHIVNTYTGLVMRERRSSQLIPS